MNEFECDAKFNDLILLGDYHAKLIVFLHDIFVWMWIFELLEILCYEMCFVNESFKCAIFINMFSWLYRFVKLWIPLLMNFEMYESMCEWSMSP